MQSVLQLQKSLFLSPTVQENALALPKRTQPKLKQQTRTAITVQATAMNGVAVVKQATSQTATTSGRNYVEQAKSAYLAGRAKNVSEHFPTALGVDDFLARVEIALHTYGFDADNTIAMTNLCRDEVTGVVKNKIDEVFGFAFNTNGLGGVLTCGVTGMKAGLSHAPLAPGTGKERYVFFSFPHTAIDASGEVGNISRPGRPGKSCACGALAGALGKFKAEGITCNCKKPGVHDALDPEFTILVQRLARRLRYEGVTDENVDQLDLVQMTKVAERTITDDLEYLIEKSVDPSKADYAVVTGVQIHSYGLDYDDEHPNLEFIAPASVYVVVNGEKTYLDLNTVPALTPRQIALVAKSRNGESQEGEAGSAATTTVHYEPSNGMGGMQDSYSIVLQRECKFTSLMQEVGIEPETTRTQPRWQDNMKASNKAFHPSFDVAQDYDKIYFSTEGAEPQAAAPSLPAPTPATTTPPSNEATPAQEEPAETTVAVSEAPVEVGTPDASENGTPVASENDTPVASENGASDIEQPQPSAEEEKVPVAVEAANSNSDNGDGKRRGWLSGFFSD